MIKFESTRVFRAVVVGLLSLPLLVSCAKPLVKAPASTKVVVIGTGRVISHEATVEKNSESRAARAALGFASAGLLGLAAASAVESEMGTSRLTRYVIDTGKPQNLTVVSFSHAAVGECVKVTRVGSNPHSILQRLSSQVDADPADGASDDAAPISVADVSCRE